MNFYSVGLGAGRRCHYNQHGFSKRLQGIIFAERIMSPDGDSPVPKGAWILDKLRAGFLSGPFFVCAKIKDFFILRELSFPHSFSLIQWGFYITSWKITPIPVCQHIELIPKFCLTNFKS